MAGIIVPIGVSLTGLQAGLAQVQSMFSQLGAKIGGMKVPSWLSFLSFGTAIHQLKALVDEFDRLNDLAKRFDVDVESFQRLSFIAKQGGTDIEVMAKSLTVMTRNLGSTGAAGEKAREALARIGIEAQAFVKLSPEEQLYALADAFEKSGGDAEEFSTILELVGRGGGELVPTLREGGAALRELGAQATIASEESVKAIAAMNDELDKFIANLKATAAQDIGNVLRMFRVLREQYEETGLHDIWPKAIERMAAEVETEAYVAPMEPAISIEEYKRQQADARNAAWAAANPFVTMRDTGASIESSLQDQIDGVLANIAAGIGDTAAKAAGVAAEAAAEAAAEPMDSLLSSLARIGGGGSDLPSFDGTTNAIKANTATLGGKLDKIIANTAPRPDAPGGAATWA